MQASAGATAQIAIDAHSVHAVVHLPTEELDLLLRLDRDLDGAVSAREVTAARTAVAAYLSDHLLVKADGTPLPMQLQSLTLAATGSVEAVVNGTAGARLSKIAIDSTLLREVSEASTTRADIRVNGRTETFVFGPGASFEHRFAADRLTAALLVAAAIAALGLLWLFRRRRATACALLMLSVAGAANADVILSATGLNAVLKTIERLQHQTGAEATFQVGAEADGLADVLNLEVDAHGMQERALIDLALRRSKDLGVAIAYNRDKKRFFYDGAAFAAYLAAQPRGPHAADAAFKLLSYAFYQLSPTDEVALTAAVGATRRFLAWYPTFAGNAEVRLFLAVDYRDLYRWQLDNRHAGDAAKYRVLAATECRRLMRLYPGSEQADAARQLLTGLQRSR